MATVKTPSKKSAAKKPAVKIVPYKMDDTQIDTRGNFIKSPLIGKQVEEPYEEPTTEESTTEESTEAAGWEVRYFKQLEEIASSIRKAGKKYSWDMRQEAYRTNLQRTYKSKSGEELKRVVAALVWVDSDGSIKATSEADRTVYIHVSSVRKFKQEILKW